MKTFEIYIDGASKGNPGPSGIGVIICQGLKTLKNISSYIGYATNNIAEYTALICALQQALILKAEALTIKTDSQLLARQLNKVYKVKHKNIIGLYNQAVNLIAGFKEVAINHIPREENIGADKLATEAIKKELKKPVFKIGGKCSFEMRQVECGRSAFGGEESPGSRG